MNIRHLDYSSQIAAPYTWMCPIFIGNAFGPGYFSRYLSEEYFRRDNPDVKHFIKKIKRI